MHSDNHTKHDHYFKSLVLWFGSTSVKAPSHWYCQRISLPVDFFSWLLTQTQVGSIHCYHLQWELEHAWSGICSPRCLRISLHLLSLFVSSNFPGIEQHQCCIFCRASFVILCLHVQLNAKEICTNQHIIYALHVHKTIGKETTRFSK